MEQLQKLSTLIKDICIPIAAVFGIISTAIGVWLSLKEYRIKALSETRLNRAARIEADINLLKLFSELMGIAHASGTYQVSEKAIEMLLQTDTIRSLVASGNNVNFTDLLSQAVVSIPVGVASQDAAIAAIATLGKRHEVLLQASIQGLESLSQFKKEVTDKHIGELKGLLKLKNSQS
jgi:hypothetical protein